MQRELSLATGNNRAEVLNAFADADLQRAAELVCQGGIVVMAFNGLYALLGDADDPATVTKIAAAKGRPQEAGLALVCGPELLEEHVDVARLSATSNLAQGQRRLAALRDLYSGLQGLGVILPALAPVPSARAAAAAGSEGALKEVCKGAPAHIVQNGTILVAWTEYTPHEPVRSLIAHMRRMGRRALAGPYLCSARGAPHGPLQVPLPT